MHANLLTYSFQSRLLVWRRFRQWSLVWLSLLIIGGAWAAGQLPSLRTARERLDVALSASEPTRIVLGEIEGMESELAEEDRRMQNLLRFGPDGRPLTVFGAIVEATRAAGGRLYLRSVQYANPAPLAAPGKTKDAAPSTLIIEGVSLDDESVDRFVHDLLATGEVTHVELKSCIRESSPATVPAAPGRGKSASVDAESPAERLRFELHCRV